MAITTNGVMPINLGSSESGNKPWRLSPSNSGEINIQTKDKYLDRNIEVSIPKATFSGGNTTLEIKDPEIVDNPNLVEGLLSPYITSWDITPSYSGSTSDIFSSGPTITETSTAWKITRKAPVTKTTETLTSVYDSGATKKTATNISVSNSNKRLNFTTSEISPRWVTILRTSSATRPKSTTTGSGSGTKQTIVSDKAITVSSNASATGSSYMPPSPTNVSSISITGMSGEPLWFIIERSSTENLTYSSYGGVKFITSIIFDGTSIYATYINSGKIGVTSNISKTYSGTTLTLTVNDSQVYFPIAYQRTQGASTGSYQYTFSFTYEQSMKMTYGYANSSGTAYTRKTSSTTLEAVGTSLEFSTTKTPYKYFVFPSADTSADTANAYAVTINDNDSRQVISSTGGTWSTTTIAVKSGTNKTITSTKATFSINTSDGDKFAAQTYKMFYIYEDGATETVPDPTFLWGVNYEAGPYIDYGASGVEQSSGSTLYKKSNNEFYYGSAWSSAGSTCIETDSYGSTKFIDTNYTVYYGDGEGLSSQNGSGTGNLTSITFTAPSGKGYTGTYFLVRQASDSSLSYRTVVFMSSENTKQYYINTDGSYNGDTSWSVNKQNTTITFTSTNAYFTGGAQNYRLYYIPATYANQSVTYYQRFWANLTSNSIPCDTTGTYILTMNTGTVDGAAQLYRGGSLVINQTISTTGKQELRIPENDSGTPIRLIYTYQKQNSVTEIIINKNDFSLIKDIEADLARQLTEDNGLRAYSSKPSSGYYIPINTGVPLSVTSPGWINTGIGNSVSGNGYIKVPSAEATLYGGDISSGQNSGINSANISTTTNTSGVFITKSAESITGTTSGWINANDDLGSIEEKNYYINGVTVPSGKTFSTTGAGTTKFTYNSSSTGNLIANGYINNGTSSTSGDKTIISNGKWAYTEVTPSSNQQGPFYGQVVVKAASSSSLSSSSWPTSSSTSSNYSSTNFSLSAGETRYINIDPGNYTSGKSYGFTAPVAGTQESHTSYTPNSTYFTTSGGVSAGRIYANQYATSNYYIKAGSLTYDQNSTRTTSHQVYYPTQNKYVNETDSTYNTSETSISSGWVSSANIQTSVSGTVGVYDTNRPNGNNDHQSLELRIPKSTFPYDKIKGLFLEWIGGSAGGDETKGNVCMGFMDTSGENWLYYHDANNIGGCVVKSSSFTPITISADGSTNFTITLRINNSAIEIPSVYGYKITMWR